MAEAVAPPQAEPSFFNKVGDVFRGMLTGGISLDDNTPAGAVAPAPVVPAVAAAPVKAPDISAAYVLPVSVKDKNIAATAAANGSAQSYLQAASQADTPEARQALLLRANNVIKGDAKYADTLGKVDAKGGINSPEGRLEYQKLWRNRDNNPEYMNAFIQYLMGNTKAAKSYLSGGQVTNKTQIDTTTGHAIQYAVDENGEYHGAYDLKTGEQLLPSQFGELSGRLGTLDQSVPYNQYKENIKDWTAKFNNEVENANVKGAASDSMYNAYDSLGKALDSKDISPLMAQEILQFSKQTIGSSASQSKAAQALKQKIDSGNLTQGQKVSAELAASIGASIPGLAGATFKGNGIFETSEGNKIDINQLSQGMATANSSAAMEKSLTANAEDVLRNAKAKGLFEQDPTGVKYKQFATALDLAKTIALQEAKIGSNPFNLPTIAFGVTDEFARGRIQAEQGKFNQLANKAYAQYANDMVSKFGPGDAPRPGNLVKGFVASDEYKALLADFKNKANTILKTADTYVTPKDSNLAAVPTAVVPPKEPALGANVLQQYGGGGNVAADLAALKAAKEKPAGSAAPPTKKTPSLDDIASKFRK